MQGALAEYGAWHHASARLAPIRHNQALVVRQARYHIRIILGRVPGFAAMLSSCTEGWSRLRCTVGKADLFSCVVMALRPASLCVVQTTA